MPNTKLKHAMDKLKGKNLDAFFTRENARYLSETPASGLVIFTRKKSILLCGRLDYDKAMNESVTDEVRGYSKSKVPLRKGENILVGKLGEIIGTILEDLEVDTVGHDEIDSKVMEDVRERYETDYREENEFLREMRKTKTPGEIELMKKAARLAEKGMEKAEEVIEPGITELEVAAELEYEMRKAGSNGTAFNTIVGAGENSKFPHMEPGEKEIDEGNLIVVDLGAEWRGYKSDMTRTFSVSPTSKQKKIMNLVQEAQKAGLEKVEAGIEAQKVDEAARKVFRENNMEEFYLHNLGHGVGLDIHEAPTLSPSSEDTLKENMVVTIEPGLYMEKVGGCRFEDTVVVRENGYEKLTDY